MRIQSINKKAEIKNVATMNIVNFSFILNANYINNILLVCIDDLGLLIFIEMQFFSLFFENEKHAYERLKIDNEGSTTLF